jgi:hypothetical protein
VARKRLDFDLHGLRQKLPSTSSRSIGQRIVDIVGLTKGICGDVGCTDVVTPQFSG